MTRVLMVVGIGFIVLIGMIFAVMFAAYFKLWLRGFVTGARISPFTLVFMKLRKVNPTTIVDTKISAVQAGLPYTDTAALEAHYLAGGNVQRVVRALIAAHRANIELDWDTAAAIDLAGVVDVVLDRDRHPEQRRLVAVGEALLGPLRVAPSLLCEHDPEGVQL